MLPLARDYAGSTCELKTMDNDLLAMCRIIKIDHDALEFAAGDSEYLPLVRYRQTIKIVVHHKKLPDVVLVGCAYLSTNNFMRIEEVRSIANFERRGAFRVNTDTDGKLYPFMSEEQHRDFDERVAAATPEEAEKLIANSFIPVQVVDISLTGARLKSDTRLMLGDRYYLEFMLLNNLKNYGLKVQRIIPSDDGTDQYGCTFFDMSDRSVDILCRDLFQLQRLEKIRRNNTNTPI